MYICNKDFGVKQEVSGGGELKTPRSERNFSWKCPSFPRRTTAKVQISFIWKDMCVCIYIYIHSIYTDPVADSIIMDYLSNQMNKQKLVNSQGLLVTNPRCGAILGTSPVIIANENLWLRFGVDVFGWVFGGAQERGRCKAAIGFQRWTRARGQTSRLRHPKCNNPKIWPHPQVEKVFHVLDGYPTLDYPTSSRPILIAAARGHKKPMPRSHRGRVDFFFSQEQCWHHWGLWLLGLRTFNRVVNLGKSLRSLMQEESVDVLCVYAYMNR